MRHLKHKSHNPNSRIRDIKEARLDLIAAPSPTLYDLCQALRMVVTDRQRRKFANGKGAAFNLLRALK